MNNAGAFFSSCITARIVPVSPASPVNVQVSGFLKEAARRHLPVPPGPAPPASPLPTPYTPWVSSLCAPRSGKSAVSIISCEAQLSARRSVFIFTKLSLLVSPLLNAICRLWELWDIFMIRFLNTQGDEGKVFREHKSHSSRLLSAG